MGLQLRPAGPAGASLSLSRPLAITQD